MRRLAASRWASAVVLLITALALRWWQFGNPVVQVDDQFYRLVGARMLDGAWPYVDIWDRKPIGLFLIYAAMAALPGDPVVVSQVVATVFAAATAFVLQRIAIRFASPGGGLFAGMAYLAFLGRFGGDAGQSPVFYNLLVAIAALWTVDAATSGRFHRGEQWRAAGAMIAMGLAMQVKYTALFEGAYFGVALVWAAVRAGMPAARILRHALLWIALALAPTAVAYAVYALAGHAADFIFANFLSIFLRNGDPWQDMQNRLQQQALWLRPMMIAGVVGWCAMPRYGAPGEAQARLVTGWTIAATLGWAVFGTWFDHYLLPVLAPLAVMAASVLGARGLRLALSIVLVWSGANPSIKTIKDNRRDRGDGKQLASMTRFIEPRLTGCLYVYDGESALYGTTHSCLPTRWGFPDHLNNMHENGAIGVDTLAETRRIMDGRPSVVVTSAWAQTTQNRRTWHYMYLTLHRDYYLAGRWHVGGRDRLIYLRNGGGRSQKAADPSDTETAAFL